MTQIKTTTILGKMDLKLIGRDRFMIFLLGFIVYLGVMLRFLLPWLNTYLIDAQVLPGERVAQSLEQMYPMVIAYLGLFDGALLIGTILGFMLIDERDNNTLVAMAVTPLPLNRYIRHKSMVAFIMGICAIVALVLFINQTNLPLWQTLVISAGAALAAPLTALFYASFAEDKVQGFALTKMTGIGGLFIPIAWFVDGPWQWCFGIFPPFWFSKAFWLAHEGSSMWWLALVIGVVFNVLLIGLLSRRLEQRV